MDYENLLERLLKSFEDCKSRIKTAENYMKDKFEATKELIKEVDDKA